MNSFIRYFFILFFIHTRYTHSMHAENSTGKNIDLYSQVNVLEKDLKNLRSECRLVLDTGVSQFKKMNDTISAVSRLLLNNINDRELIIPGLENSIKRIQDLEKEIKSTNDRIDKLDQGFVTIMRTVGSSLKKEIDELKNIVNLNDLNLIGQSRRMGELKKGFLLMGMMFSLVIIFQQYQIYMLKQK